MQAFESEETLEIVYIGRLESVRIVDNYKAMMTQYVFAPYKGVRVPVRLARHLLTGRTDFMMADKAAMSLVELHPSGGEVTVDRWGALGDVLIVRACCSAMRRERPEFRFSLRTTRGFVGLFADDPLWRVVSETLAVGARAFNLDHFMERDHAGLELSRVEIIMERLMGAGKRLNITAEDWAIPTGDAVKSKVDGWLAKRGLTPGKRERPLIVVQSRGSGDMKTVPRDQMMRLTKRLSDTDEEGGLGHVVVFDHKEPFVWEHSGCYPLHSESALFVLELMRRADVAVVMDSGPLWLAHAAGVKTMAILGPTRWQQRLCEHPLWLKDGVRYVQLNDTVRLPQLAPATGCQACHEQALACKGTYACLRQRSDDDLIEPIVEQVADLLHPAK